MGARRRGRELAVQALYQIDVTDASVAAALLWLRDHCEGGDKAKEFARTLVTGVVEHRDSIDALIGQSSEHWRFERLSRVDLNVLRVATYELSYTREVPPSVVIDEAIEIARRFGTTASAEFVNGVLDQIATRLGVKGDSAHGGPGHHG